MGRLARLLSFVRAANNVSDAKVDPGGGANITAQHFAPAGEDAHPLPSDYVLLVPDSGTGREIACGYLDGGNAPTSQAGDKRIYARDSSTGDVVAEVWLQNDGTATVSNSTATFEVQPNGTISGDNGAGAFQLTASGDFVINGVTIAANGAVTVPTSLTLGGKEIADHTHDQANDSAGNTEQPTGPNN